MNRKWARMVPHPLPIRLDEVHRSSHVVRAVLPDLDDSAACAEISWKASRSGENPLAAYLFPYAVKT